MLWISVLILIVLVVGFSSIHWRLSTMRDEMNQEFDALAEELSSINTVAESAVALIEHQGEQLKAIIAGADDPAEIKSRLSALVDAGEAVKAKLANAVAANTAATSDEHPIETPLPDTTSGGGTTGGDVASDPTGGDSGGESTATGDGGATDAGTGVDAVQEEGGDPA